ncbi:uncharacterized protein [Palaemon carinicauda]|uniref:uncharacterized protein n=1 Tax=Palaemon carinicauda TaxID=392227 RepID=UPI0035B57699
MKILIEWLFIASTLMHHGLDAAPQEATSHAKDGVSDYRIQPKKISLDPNPPFEVRPYPEELLPTHPNPLANLTALDVLKYADNMFDFVKVVDQDKIYATEVLDDSWKGWLKYFQHFPITSLFRVKEANEIENPNEDAPYTIWDQLLFQLVRGFFVTNANEESDAEDEETEATPTIENKYTSIKFDPIGQFANGILQVLKYYSGYENIYDWMDKLEEEIKNYSAFTEEVNDKSEIDQSVADAALQAGGVVAFPLPASVLRIARFDPFAIGVNALLFVGFHLFFWGVFVPVSSYASFFADIDNEDDVNLPDDMEDEGEGEGGEEGEGGGGEDGEEGAGEGEQDAGDGGDGNMEDDEGDPGVGDQQADDMELADDLQPPEEPADTMQPPGMELSDDLQPPPMEPADNLQQGNTGQPGQQGQQDNFGQQDQPANFGQQGQQDNFGQQGQQDNFGQQGQQGNFAQQDQQANFGQQGQQANFGQQGQQANFGQQGQQANFGQQGQQVNFGQQGQQANFGQQGQQANFGQQGQQANFGQQGQQANFGQQAEPPPNFLNVGQGVDNTRRRDPYNHHNYYNNGYSNYYDQSRYKNVPRPYAYHHGSYNNRHKSGIRPQYQYRRYSNRRGTVPAPQYRPDRKYSPSSNYYSHGAVGPHESYTPQDTNIYPQGK